MNRILIWWIYLDVLLAHKPFGSLDFKINFILFAHMNSDNYEEIPYGHYLNLWIMLHSSHISCPRRSGCWAKSIHFRLAYLDNNRNTKNCKFPLKWSETWRSHFLILLAGKSKSYFTNVSPILAISSHWDHFQPKPAIVIKASNSCWRKSEMSPGS